MSDVNKLAEAYIAIRDKRAEIKKAFETEYEALGKGLELLGAQMLLELQSQHAESIKTEHGTIYRQEEIKPSCADWMALDTWMKAHPEYGASDVLEKRVSKKFVQEYMAGNNDELPAGINIYREYVVRVRRSN